jgi:Nuclease-related domain
MRIVELSNHPGEMLQDIHLQQRTDLERAQSKYEAELAQHYNDLDDLHDRRDQARAQRRWWLWLRCSLSIWGQGARVPRPPVLATGPTHSEDILTAGMAGEQAVADELGYVLDDDWTLMRGYSNRRGEIDHVLLGPQGVFAIEVKHRNATVYVDGDSWKFEKYDNYDNLVDDGWIEDRRGRSPSVQLNEPADDLERFLRSRGQPVKIGRIVMLTHPKSELGGTRNLTVNVVATSTDYVINFLDNSPTVFHSQQLGKLEQLIVRDHHFHEARQSSR